MTHFQKFIASMAVIIVALLVFIGILKIIEDEFIDKGKTLRLTQNSEFVVEKVRGGQQWEYHFKTTETLTDSNFDGSQKINTLIVQTDKPIGYAVGDTLRLLNYNIEPLTEKLR